MNTCSNITNFKPMLAATLKEKKDIHFPVFASPKLDGVRAIIIDGKVMSRRLKPIPNAYVQKLFGKQELNYLDGELICGDPTDSVVFRKTTSAVMSRGGNPDVKFHVFDDVTNYMDSFDKRIISASNRIIPPCLLVHHFLIQTMAELDAVEERWLSEGYEGVMLRHPHGPYKFGRSTLAEAFLFKLKRFEDSEAEIIGFVEQMQNTNNAFVNGLGMVERSTSKEGLLGKNTLGALKVRDLTTGVEFDIGTGFDENERKHIWDNANFYLRTIVKYKFFPTGTKEKPRFPVYLGFRNVIDM